jgi:hypothetical protein
MVGHHVAQRTGRFVEIATLLHPDSLGNGDLDMIHAVAVPDRLEHPVGEAQRHDVLHGLLSEEVVDPVDLVLPEHVADMGIQLAGGRKTVPKRLLDHDAAPISRPVFGIALARQTDGAEAVDHRPKEAVGNREIENRIALCAVAAFGCLQRVVKVAVETGVGEIALQIVHSLREAVPSLLVDMTAIELGCLADRHLQEIIEAASPAFRAFLGAGDTDHHEPVRKETGSGEIVERRDQETLGQITARAENHHGARTGWPRLMARRTLQQPDGLRRRHIVWCHLPYPPLFSVDCLPRGFVST